MVYVLYLVGRHVLWGSIMRQFVIVFVWCLVMVGIGTCVNLNAGCAGDGKRETWQDCAGVSHYWCYDSDDTRACEYEYYKRCINE